MRNKLTRSACALLITTTLITIGCGESDIGPQPDSGIQADLGQGDAAPSLADAGGDTSPNHDASSDTSSTTPQKPGPSNTGPNQPGLLTPSGTIIVTQDNTIVENVDVTGIIRVEAQNVTIRNFRVDCGGASYGVKVESQGSAVIEHGEIVGCTSSGLYGQNFEARYLNIHEQGADAVKVYGDNLVEYCWFHHIGTNDNAHADGVQTRSGSNITFRYNNFDLPIPDSPNGPGAPYKSNAAAINQAKAGNISNMVFEGNWLNGGGYTIYITAPTTYTLDGFQLINNRFGRDYRFGPLRRQGAISNVVVSGNVWDDSGVLMDIND